MVNDDGVLYSADSNSARAEAEMIRSCHERPSVEQSVQHT